MKLNAADKIAYIQDMTKLLVTHFGKKDFYRAEEVKYADERSEWFHVLDNADWAIYYFSKKRKSTSISLTNLPEWSKQKIE